MNMFGERFSTIHCILKSTRLEVANLEAKVKLEFDGNEYLDFKDLNKVIKDLKDILTIRPIVSPFE